jgi:hypothetical protein
MTAGDYTAENFQFCLQDIIKDVIGFFVQSINFTVSSSESVLKGVEKDVGKAKGMINSIRSQISNVTQSFYQKFMNIVIAVQEIIIKFRDMMSKIQGLFAATIYTLLGTYLGLEALTGSIVQIAIIMLVALAAIIALMWIFFFTWPVAASLTVLYAIVAVPLALIIHWAEKNFTTSSGKGWKSHLKKHKRHPKCFHQDTLIQMNDGTFKKISKIIVGDILKNNNCVTTTITVTAEDSLIYKLDNVIVSDTHKVYYKNNIIYVKDHPDAVKLSNVISEYLYCLNTENKTIEINNTIFCDWDDLSYGDYCLLINKEKDKEKEFGFSKNTQIKLLDGEYISISKIKVGDILEGGEKVYGIVRVLGNLYHLLTDSEIFRINDFYVGDYNIYIDKKNIL